MYNLFRRIQQPIIITVSVLTIISFIGFYSKSDFLDKGSSSHVAMIYGHTVTLAQAQRAGRKGDLSQQLGNYDRDLADLWRSLAVTQRDARENFIWNSMVLKHEAERLGVEPTDDEIFESMKAIPLFQTNGVYDSTKYALMTQILLTPRGFTTEDLTDVIADALRVKKIKALLGATVAPSPKETRDLFIRVNQKTQASVIRFKLDDFMAATQVPEADVKKLYEDRKASLKSEELRKVKFVAFVLPVTDKPLEGKERAAALTDLQKKAEDFAVAMTEKDAKFDEVAARDKVKVEESPEFSINKPPEVLGSSREVATAAFKLNQHDPNSDVIEAGRGYYVVQLAGITPPRPLTFDEARANLTDMLKHERAQEALNLKASEVRNKIEADIKAGKTFAEAAQAEGVKAEDFPPFSMREAKRDLPDADEIMHSAMEMNEGQISSAMPTADGSIIIYVAKRLPVDEKDIKTGQTAMTESIGEAQRVSLFQEWLKLRRAAAQVNSNLRS